MADANETLKDPPREKAAPQAPRALGPMLFLLACADDLSRPSLRLPLRAFAEVSIGRTEGPSVAAKGASLSIGLADAYASSRHATLESPGGAWHLRDGGSTNGTWLNGKQLDAGERVELAEGDLLQAGHTFFLFRAATRGLPGTEAGTETLSPEWEAELARAAVLARSSHAVLIQGESGAGKEVLAQRLHALSGRKPLVSLNCAAVAENLLDDELFGHVRGAFSGAEKDREGLLRAADGGTLFLDEVGDMPPAMQVKLLRFLEEQRVRPVGSDREIAVEVRLIAATHRDLRERVEAGRFRDDLLARLGVLPLRVPALRERREDLGLLLRALLPAKVRFTPEAMALVCGYSWPRNVRELRAAVLSAADLAAAAGEASIAPHHLPEPVRHPPKAAEPKPLPELTEADRELRDRVGGLLRQHGGNISAVARELGKGRTQIHRWMARFGLGS